MPEALTAKNETVVSDHDLLARRLCDVLLTGAGQLEPVELALAEMALIDLLPFLTEARKRSFAARLAPLEMAPTAFLDALLEEPFAVTEPLLAEGLCLTNCDLVRIAKRGDLEHRLCMADRPDLSLVVCDALSAKGELPVLNALLANNRASLSNGALEQIVRRSSANPELIMALLRRNDLTPWLAHLMFWWADGEERSVILKRFPIDRRALVTALSDAVDLGQLIETKSDILRSTYRLLRPAQRLSRHGHQALMKAAAGDAAEFALAKAGSISPTTASWVISDQGSEPFAILSKAMGLTHDSLHTLANLLSTSRVSGAYSENEMERCVALFESVTMERADSILQYWDRIIAHEADFDLHV